MEDLLPILSGMRRELQSLSKSIALINKSQTQRLSEEWIRKQQVLKLLAISPRTLGKLTQTGKLPFTKINGLLYFRTSDVEKLLTEHYLGPVSSAPCSTPQTMKQWLN